MAQKVREVMTKDPVCLESDTTVLEAAQRMRDQNIGDVLVMSGGKLHGIVTDRDMVVRALAEKRDPTQTTIGEVASAQLATLSPEDAIDEAVRMMEHEAVRRIPVVEDDRPVGIVSIGDLAIERDRQSALGQISAAPPNR